MNHLEVLQEAVIQSMTELRLYWIKWRCSEFKPALLIFKFMSVVTLNVTSVHISASPSVSLCTVYVCGFPTANSTVLHLSGLICYFTKKENNGPSRWQWLSWKLTVFWFIKTLIPAFRIETVQSELYICCHWKKSLMSTEGFQRKKRKQCPLWLTASGHPFAQAEPAHQFTESLLSAQIPPLKQALLGD